MAHRKLGDYELSSERRKDDGLLSGLGEFYFWVKFALEQVIISEMRAMSMICLIVVLGEVNYLQIPFSGAASVWGRQEETREVRQS